MRFAAAYLFLAAAMTVGLYGTYKNHNELKNQNKHEFATETKRDLQIRLAVFTTCRSDGRTIRECQRIARGIILPPLTPVQEKKIIKVIGKPQKSQFNTLIKEVGKRGMAGPRGLPGKNGTNGKNGERGPRGLRGIPGKNGVNGSKGDKGNAGPQGPPGIQGPAGPPGPICPAGYTAKEVRVVGTGSTLGITSNITILACVKN
jgi:hypothetical protein